MQTDSEHTDFAFDGEMTATEVCTFSKELMFHAFKKKKKKKGIRLLKRHEIWRMRALEVTHVVHAIDLLLHI